MLCQPTFLPPEYDYRERQQKDSHSNSAALFLDSLEELMKLFDDKSCKNKLMLLKTIIRKNDVYQRQSRKLTHFYCKYWHHSERLRH
eukprot:430392-Pleurochrysis_carterae.AAC.3